MKNFLFSLDDRTDRFLDQIAEDLGCSRSAALRIAVRFYQDENHVRISSPENLNNLPDLPFVEEVLDD